MLKIKKFISKLLVLSIILLSIPRNVLAEENFSNNNFYLDGYNITVIENTDKFIKVKTKENDKEYILELDLIDNEFKLNTLDKNSRDIQDVIVEEANNDTILAKVSDGDIHDGFTIDTQQEKDPYDDKIAIVVGSGAAAAALIKAILALGAVVIVGGATWYTASKVISRLKRDQPQIHYYTARLYNGNVLIGSAIKSKSSAAARLKSQGDVFAISSGYAYDACKSASPIKSVSSRQKHGSGNSQYYHYHAMLTPKVQMKSHCWYI